MNNNNSKFSWRCENSLEGGTTKDEEKSAGGETTPSAHFQHSPLEDLGQRSKREFFSDDKIYNRKFFEISSMGRIGLI